MTDLASADPASALITRIAVWPPDVLARHLVSEDPAARIIALGMAVQPDVQIDQCIEELVRAATLSLHDPLAARLAATAFGCLSPGNATDSVQACLVTLVADNHGMPIRISAAHAMFRLRCLPVACHESLCAMLIDEDPGARKVALLAFTPFAPSAAAAIAGRVAHVSPEHWTSEALIALARSAGDSAAGRRSVEGFLMRSLAGASLVPTGIAAYGALAQLNPQGAATPALIQISGNASDAPMSNAALMTLAELGELAHPVAKDIAVLLATTEEPAREEQLCRTLLRLRVSPQDLPLERILQRLSNGPDRSAAAHLMLLCLHPIEFAKAAVTVRQRFAGASEALRLVLSQAHETLTGTKLDGSIVVKGI